MKAVSSFAVNRPITTIMLFISLVLLGVVSLNRLAIDLLPEVEFPAISIFTTYGGVGPEEIETLITRPVEQAVSTIQGLDRIDSFSAEGRSRVSLRFAWGVSLDGALNDVRAAIERIRDVLPEDASPPVVFKFDLNSFPIMMLTLSGDMEEWRLRRLADETIKYRLERVEGVAAVDIRGGIRREIHVELSADKISSFGITTGEIEQALRRDNVNIPGGDVYDRGFKVTVRTLGEFRSVKEIEETIVAIRNGAPVRIKDIGSVTDSYEEPVNAVFVDGEPGIRLGVSKISGANTVEVAEHVKREVERINRDIPNVKLNVRFDTSKYIRNSISSVTQGIFYGAFLAVFILLLFLRSVKATLIISAAIPIAVIGTFALMFLGKFTLNMISFGGIALGIGLLVDNSIVVLENIQRHLERGALPKPAAIEGAGEVSTAIVASTLTTVCIFVPVIFITGFAGIFFGQLAFVVSFALICSLAVALMLVPLLSSLRPADGKSERTPKITKALERLSDDIESAYERLLRKVIYRRKSVYSISVVLLIVSLMLFPLIGVELMPESDQNEVRITAEAPIGTPLEKSSEIALFLDSQVRKLTPERRGSISLVGAPGYWSDAGSNWIEIRTDLNEIADRSRSSEEIAVSLRPYFNDIPDVVVRVRAGEGFWLFQLLRGGGERIMIEVRGYSLDTALKLSKQIADSIKKIPGVTDVNIDMKEGNREAVVNIDRDKAAGLGLSVGYIGDVISTFVLGKRVSYYREGGDEFGILVRLRESDRLNESHLEQIPLITPKGEFITLGNIASIERNRAPVAIRRLNQERIVSVSAGFSGRDLGSIIGDIREQLSSITTPEGFSIHFGGEFEEQQKTFAQLIIGLFLAIALVYMVMASLFESLVQPFLMLFAIPFAFVGVVASLMLTATTFNVYSFLGTIVLMGIVVNNAIVLVDYTNLLRTTYNLELFEAVAQAGRRRLRPILMTTLTTILALLPVAIGIGEGSEMQAPLARVIIGGLLVSTLITLVLIPSLYITVESRRARKKP
ncbi:MAG: efflux RND transporter permease subunit [Myxococcota bacterium]